MLDLKKLDKEFDKILNSYTREDILEWMEFDKKRMALAKKNKGVFQEPYIFYNGKLNGTPSSAAKSKSVPVKTTKVTPPSKVRARNSAKSRATANTW